MRIDTSGIHIELTEHQREYARTRLWIATRGVSTRLAWVGLWLTDASAEGADAFVCRITSWLRGVGPVNVAQSADEPLAAIDMAAARLEQALRRATRVAGRPRRSPRHRGTVARPARGRARPTRRKPLKAEEAQNDWRCQHAQAV